jgi:hypothetical protein
MLEYSHRQPRNLLNYRRVSPAEGLQDVSVFNAILSMMMGECKDRWKQSSRLCGLIKSKYRLVLEGLFQSSPFTLQNLVDQARLPSRDRLSVL